MPKSNKSYILYSVYIELEKGETYDRGQRLGH